MLTHLSAKSEAEEKALLYLGFWHLPDLFLPQMRCQLNGGKVRPMDCPGSPKQ